MKERTERILETAVRDFIKTGKLITSEYLYRKYDFGIKPAMIRLELGALHEAGYFEQRHPSGGRIPTNRAYRFLVDRMISDEENSAKSHFSFTTLLSEFFGDDRKTFVRDFSRTLEMLGIAYEPITDLMYESGLQTLLGRFETETKEEIMEVIKDFEHLPQRLENSSKWWRNETRWPQVFIGANPFTSSNHLSLVANGFRDAEREFLLIAVGPKRMDYGKPLRFFQALQHALNCNCKGKVKKNLWKKNQKKTK